MAGLVALVLSLAARALASGVSYDFTPTNCPEGSRLASPGGRLCFAALKTSTFDYSTGSASCVASLGPGAHLAAPQDASERRAVEAACTSPTAPLAWLGVTFSVPDPSVRFPDPSTYVWSVSSGASPTFFTDVNGGARDWWSVKASRFGFDGLHFPPLPSIASMSPVSQSSLLNSTCIVLVTDPGVLFNFVSPNSTALIATPCYSGLPNVPCCSFPSSNGTAIKVPNSSPQLLGVQRPVFLLVANTMLAASAPPIGLMPSPTDPVGRGGPSDPIPITLPADESLHYPGIALYTWARDADSPSLPAGTLTFSLQCGPSTAATGAPLPFVIDSLLGWVTASSSLMPFLESSGTCELRVRDGLGLEGRPLFVRIAVTRGYPAISTPALNGWQTLVNGRSYSYITTAATDLSYAEGAAVCLSLDAQLPSFETEMDFRAYWILATTENTQPRQGTWMSPVRREDGSTSCGYVSLPSSNTDPDADPCVTVGLSIAGVLPIPSDTTSADGDCLCANSLTSAEEPDNQYAKTRPISATILPETCQFFRWWLICEKMIYGMSYLPNVAPSLLLSPPSSSLPYMPSGADANGKLQPVGHPGLRLGSDPCHSSGAGPLIVPPQCAVSAPAGAAPHAWSLYLPDDVLVGSSLLNLGFLAIDVDSPSPVAYRAGRLVYSLGPFAPVNASRASFPSNRARASADSLTSGSPIVLDVVNPPGTLRLSARTPSLRGLWRNATAGWGVCDVMVSDGFGAVAPGYVRLHVIVLGCDSPCSADLAGGPLGFGSQWEAVPCTSFSNRLCLSRSNYPPPLGLALLALYVSMDPSGSSQPVLPGAPGGITIAEGDPTGRILASGRALIGVLGFIVIASLAVHCAVAAARCGRCGRADTAPWFIAETLRVPGHESHVNVGDASSTVTASSTSPVKSASHGMERTVSWLIASTTIALAYYVLVGIALAGLLQAAMLLTEPSGIMLTESMKAALRPAGSTWAARPGSPSLANSLFAAGVLNAGGRLEPPPWTQFQLPYPYMSYCAAAVGAALQMTAWALSLWRALTSPWGRRLRSGHTGAGLDPSSFLVASAILLDSIALRNGACALFAARAVASQPPSSSAAPVTEWGSGLDAQQPEATLTPSRADSVVDDRHLRVVTPHGLWLHFFLEAAASAAAVVACVAAGVGMGSICFSMSAAAVLHAAFSASVEDPWVLLSSILTCCLVERRSFTKRHAPGLVTAARRASTVINVARVSMESTVRRLEDARGLEHESLWFANPVARLPTGSDDSHTSPIGQDGSFMSTMGLRTQAALNAVHPAAHAADCLQPPAPQGSRSTVPSLPLPTSGELLDRFYSPSATNEGSVPAWFVPYLPYFNAPPSRGAVLRAASDRPTRPDPDRGRVTTFAGFEDSLVNQIIEDAGADGDDALT
jgi:hypothetical protein